MQFAILAILVVHALLHVLGFLKVFGLAELPALTGQTLVPLGPGLTRVMGVAWLLAALVLLGAASMRALRLDAWWTLGLVGIVISQALIVLQWQDAKAGTAANLLIALAIARGLFELARRTAQ